MSIYDLLIIVLVAAVAYVAGVISTLKIDETHNRINKDKKD